VTADLYAALDVPRDADHAAIRRAYRLKARDTHPDTPNGSKASFALVKLAHDTLTDEQRRARYDQTGEAEENPVDNSRAQLMEMLATGLEMAMQHLYERSKPPIQSDMIRLMKDSLRKMRSELTKAIHEFQKNVDRSKELLGRWSTDGENIMEVIVVNRVRHLEAQIALLTSRVAVVDQALGVLDRVRFTADPVPEERRGDGMAYITFGDLMARRW